jgi:hypothetical protein
MLQTAEMSKQSEPGEVVTRLISELGVADLGFEPQRPAVMAALRRCEVRADDVHI